MKNLKFLLRFSALLVLCLVASKLSAQTPENPFETGTNAGAVFTWYTALYGGVVTALTYLQAAFFPKAGAVPKTAVRYILIAGVTAAIFITLGLSNGLGVFIGFIGSALTYDKVLAPLGLKTATPKISG